MFIHSRLTPFLLALCWGLVPAQAGAPGKLGPLGLKPPTPAERAWMEAHLIRVETALPNRLALARVAAERGQPKTKANYAPAPLPPAAEDGAEFRGSTLLRSRVAVQALVAGSNAIQPASAMAYPSAVDNSAEPWFPPIGSQLGGSCASFSTTYYTMTSQVARLRGWDVKHDNDGGHKFSTRFTYNQINGGGDNGSWITTAYDVMLTMGCATYQSLPYIDGDYVSWPTSASVWRDAINYRMADSGSIGGLDTATGLANAKQMLADGYILNYATNIGQWQFTDLKDDPGTTADDGIFAAGVSVKRRRVCTHLVEDGGSGHGMTIVGYNDDVWIDLNGNGAVDAGEKGAFRIANSWDTWWEDGGYVWIAYDALKTLSAVTGGPNPATRKPGFDGMTVYWMSARPSYTPALVAEVTVQHAKRNQMSIAIGRGASDATVPSATWSPAGLQRCGGALSFDGTSTPVQATFVLDGTDLLNQEAGQRWFVSLADNASGDPGTLANLRFVDGGNIATEYLGTNPSGGLAQNVDGATLHAYADNVFFANVAPVAQDQIVRLLKNTSRSVTLTATDSNQDVLAYGLVKSPSHGALSGAAPNLVYTPATDFQGTDDFTFKTNDGNADSNTAKVVIHVGVASAGLLSEFFHCGGGMSLLPSLTGRAADLIRVDAQINFVADADFPSTMVEDFASRHTGYLKIDTAGSYTLSLTSDDGSKLWLDDKLLFANDGTHGMIERSGTATLTAGLHALRVEYFQGNGGRGLVLKWAGPGISKAVIPAASLVHSEMTNTAPVAQGQSVTVAKNATKAIALTATDADEDGLSYSLQSRPVHGTLFGTAPNLSYLPTANYLGTDSFTFLASDGLADSNAATVSISVVAVNNAPVADNQSLTIIKNVAGKVLLTASDVDANALTYSVLTQPTHGTLSGTAPNLVYTPTSNYEGADEFTFRASDGTANSNIATVKLHVGSAVQGLLAEFFQFGGLSAIPSLVGLTPNFTRIDAQINYQVDADYPSTMVANFASRHTGYLKIDTAGNYTLYLSSDDGSKLWLDGALLIDNDGSHGMREYNKVVTLTAGYHALRVEYYQGTGGRGLTLNWSGPSLSKAIIPSTALVLVPVSNALPVAQAQNLVTAKNAAKAITLAGTDADGDPLTYTLVALPLHGTLSGTAPNVNYQPAANFMGSDPFTFKVNDGKADSNTATVMVTVGSAVAPAITAQPQSATVNAGQTATFSVTATGTAPLTYQWRKGGSAITGATAASYTTPATATSDNGAKFSVVVTNAAGTVTSSDATLTVVAANVAPAITAQPQAITVNAGQTASFSVMATGTAPLTYQWRKGGNAISGATAASYTTPATAASDNGAKFSVVVTNAAGNVTSSDATLTVTAAPVAPVLTAQPQAITVKVGQTATFTVTATGTAPLSYQWKKNGTAITGATAPSYTTPATALSDNGAKFSVVVSNAVSNVTSSDATLTLSSAKSLDLNSDGAVDVLDLATMAGAYGQSSTSADLDGSGLVNDADITLWLAGF